MPADPSLAPEARRAACWVATPSWRRCNDCSPTSDWSPCSAPGGVGKTALRRRSGARADHVTVVPLAPITDPAAIPQALAAALDLHVVHGDVLSACARCSAPGHLLLVLDNCEHLLPAVRDLVATAGRAVRRSRCWPPVESRSDPPAEQQVRLAAGGDEPRLTSTASPVPRRWRCSSIAPAASVPTSHPIRTT